MTKKQHNGERIAYIVATGMFIAGILCLLISNAFSQHPAKDQALHDGFYSTWLLPDVRNLYDGKRYVSCCDGRDCYPTQFRIVGGTWQALQRETGKWIVVPDRKFEHNAPDPRESPDGRSHLCASSSGNVYCAVLGLDS